MSTTPAETRITGLPPLSWTHGAGIHSLDDAAGRLTLVSDAGADWSNDATGGPQQHRATSLSFTPPAGPFTLSARVRVGGIRTTYDAAVLTIWHDRDHWAKLCFEYSPQGEAMVVSVVTDAFSDDVNSSVVLSDAIFLRVTSIGDGAWAFHASDDGVVWTFVRLFRLRGGDAAVRVGFMSQAPMGPDCTAEFDEITLREGAPADLRNGA